MTLDDLAKHTGEDPAELQRWASIGLISNGSDYTPADSERVRLIRFAIDRGYTAETLAEVAGRQGDIIGNFAGQLGGAIHDRSYSPAEAAAEMGVEVGLFERFRAVSGISPGSRVFEEDLEAFKLVAAVLAGGIPEDVLLQLGRVFADSQAKIADAITRLFHLYVHEPMRSSKGPSNTRLEASNAISEPLVGVIEPLIVYFHRRAWAQALAEDMMLHLAEETTLPAEVVGQFSRAILFVDLCSFTPLTEMMGDAVAAQVVGRFGDIVREAAGHWFGQVVKQIGDEFMLVFADGPAAVRCAMAIRSAATAEPRFPALRIGAHSGSVLYREGDYVGVNVNIAARVTSVAARNQFLVTSDIAAQIQDRQDVDIVDIGTRRLKGLAEPIHLFAIHHPPSTPNRSADPVCGMQLNETTAEAELNWRGTRLMFCSTKCLRRFVDDPDRYPLL